MLMLILTGSLLSSLLRGGQRTPGASVGAFVPKVPKTRGEETEGAVEGRCSHWLPAAASGAADTSGHSIIDGPVMNICSPSHAGRSRREAVFCMTCFKWLERRRGGRPVRGPCKHRPPLVTSAVTCIDRSGSFFKIFLPPDHSPLCPLRLHSVPPPSPSL